MEHPLRPSKVISLGESGCAHMKSAVRQCCSLGMLLAESVPWRMGDAQCLVDSTVQMANAWKALEGDHGGIVGSKEATEWMTCEILTSLGDISEHRALGVYDAILRPGERPVLVPDVVKVCTAQREVYLVLAGKDAGQEVIGKTLLQVGTLQCVGIVSDAAAWRMMEEKVVWDPSCLAGTTRLVFMNAFDTEGYVVWKKG